MHIRIENIATGFTDPTDRRMALAMLARDWPQATLRADIADIADTGRKLLARGLSMASIQPVTDALNVFSAEYLSRRAG